MKRKKTLSEMTLEELWELFPIFLTEHKPYWTEWYEEEVSALKNILPTDTEYHHIGSTAIRGIWAKPIIDILIVVNSENQLKETADILHKNGYIVMSSKENRISLNKGYTENGFAERVFHLHIRLKGDTDEIYFRDYLNGHPDIAKEYEELKLKLWKKYEHNRDAYTNAKTEFVKKYTGLARQTMLIKITKPDELDENKLMSIYSEGNIENADYFYPDMQDKAEAVKKVEADFCKYIKEEFLDGKNIYYVLEDKGVWVSALRIYSVENNFYYLEALETAPEFRKKGYATKLLNEVIKDLKAKGEFRLCDCVSKKNVASLNTHLKCGFKIVMEDGYDYLQKEADSRCHGLEYSYKK